MYGSVKPKDLSAPHIAFINAWLSRYENNFSKHRRAGAAKRIFRYLFEEFGAPPLHRKVVAVTQPKPRNVTATREERDKLIAAAPLHLRCWLLLCSDLAIRSGTAITLGPAHYDREQRVLTFRTKYQNTQQVPVTAELRPLLDLCTDTTLPFVAQLTRGKRGGRGYAPRPLPPIGRAMDYGSLSSAFRDLKKQLGITRKLTPHDLRRTTARRVYDHTKDMRLVQAVLGHSDLNSTVWYLQDNLIELPPTILELAKAKPGTETIQ